METLFVYADFNWLKEPELIGTLRYERSRAKGIYNFEYDKTWLSQHGGVMLCEGLDATTGPQYCNENKLFGCFSDAEPDRWGKCLIDCREQINAQKENRLPRTLFSFDYLTSIDDNTRMGGLRFKRKADGNFINTDKNLVIPPLSSVRELIDTAQKYEESEEKNELPEEKWVRQLFHPGTSLGGARPKANIIDKNGNLCIAKFPSRKDIYDVAKWEYFTNQLSKKAGIHAADAELLTIPGIPHGYHILLSKRFDRDHDGKRVHFASSMSMSGLQDGDNADSGNGYLDIADFIIEGCTHTQANLEELYRRVAFNICIGNSDDHFRNHGFLLTAEGWTLSPAYDMNPTNDEHQSILITKNSSDADLQQLLDASEDYMIPKKRCKEIIQQVKDAVKDWRVMTKQAKLTQGEITRFQFRLDEKCK